MGQLALEINLEKTAARIIAVMVALAVCGALGFAVLSNFITKMLTDDRIIASRDVLAAASDYFKNSARLHARLAEAEMLSRDRNLDRAETHAARAVSLSPWDYRNHLLLASVIEAKGDRARSEQSLRFALSLAPTNVELHWQMGNLLVREGKLGDALESFRAAVTSNAGLLPLTLDIVWRASGGSINAVSALTSGRPASELALAQFLLKQSRTTEAVTAFRRIPGIAEVNESKRSEFLNGLIATGSIETARELWVDLKMARSGLTSASERLPIWNGGFESEITSGLAQFDWVISHSDYARIGFDDRMAHTGTRSLRINFTGRDTTRLDQEIKQLVLVRPGARYKLECFVKTEKLNTPAGPQVVVTPGGSKNWLAASDPVPSGSNDWQKLAVEFVAPPDSRAVLVTVKRRPKFSYDDPTGGIIWLDDFVMEEQ